MPDQHAVPPTENQLRKPLESMRGDLQTNLERLQNAVPDKLLPDMRNVRLEYRFKPADRGRHIREGAEASNPEHLLENARAAHLFGWSIEGLAFEALQSPENSENTLKIAKGVYLLQQRLLPRVGAEVDPRFEASAMKEEYSLDSTQSEIVKQTKNVVDSAKKTSIGIFQMLHEQQQRGRSPDVPDVFEEEVKKVLKECIEDPIAEYRQKQAMGISAMPRSGPVNWAR